MTLARAADRALPVLLGLLLVALTVSITAVGVLTALVVLAALARLVDPELRAATRAPLLAPLLAYVLVSLVSALVAARPTYAVWYLKDVPPLALFLAAVNGFDDRRHLRRALAAFFVAVSVVSVYAMLQAWACASSVELPRWVGWALKVRLEACRTAEPFRAKGFFSIYMTLGGSLVIALALSLAGLVLGAGRRLPLLVPSALGFVALALTYVRSAWLGLMAAIGVLVALSGRFVLLAAVAAVVVVGLALPGVFRVKLLTAVDPAHASARERMHFWRAGAQMLRDAPLLGHGPGGVRLRYPAYRPPGTERLATSHLHNNLVQIAAERGLLGLAGWLWIWAAFFVGAGRIYRRLAPGAAEERALVGGSIAAAAGFLATGLFEYNYGDSEVIHLLAVVMALPFVVGRDATASASAPER